MVGTPSLFILGSFVVACCAKVKSFPAEGECGFAEAFTMEPGGKGFNLAIAAHRLGARVDGLFAVGDDSLAAMAESAFVRAGLAPAMLRRFPGQTGCGIGFIDAIGETRIAVFPGANARLSAETVHDVSHEIERASIVMAQFEIEEAPILAAFTIARRVGATTILNPSPFRTPSAGLLAQTSIVVVNESEGAKLPPVDAVFAAGPHTLIVTLGRRGAVLLRPGLPTLSQPAFRVETVDSLGAGDAFAAAFAVGLLEERPLETCLRRAAACGALATTRLGVFDALPSLRELEDLII